jgi:hypothetical protein
VDGGGNEAKAGSDCAVPRHRAVQLEGLI